MIAPADTRQVGAVAEALGLDPGASLPSILTEIARLRGGRPVARRPLPSPRPVVDAGTAARRERAQALGIDPDLYERQHQAAFGARR